MDETSTITLILAGFFVFCALTTNRLWASIVDSNRQVQKDAIELKSPERHQS